MTLTPAIQEFGFREVRMLDPERFIIYPYAERDADPTPVIAWAGWDHLQQAQALAGYYVQMKEREGWSPQRLKPLLAGLLELIPWLKQWHNAIDPTYGVGPGDYFADFVQEEAACARPHGRRDPSVAPVVTTERNPLAVCRRLPAVRAVGAGTHVVVESRVEELNEHPDN